MRVFISHSSADKPAVLPLAAALRAKGIDVWLDQWEIAPTDDIVQSINAGLEQAGAGIIVFSEHSEKSQWVKAEVSYLTYARIQESKPLIPVTLSDTAYVPPLLRPLLRCRIDQTRDHRRRPPQPPLRPTTPPPSRARSNRPRPHHPPPRFIHPRHRLRIPLPQPASSPHPSPTSRRPHPRP